MAAYAAVISLKQTINGLLKFDSSGVSSSREILEFAFDEAASLQRVLERLNDSSRRSERVNVLEGQIRDCAHQLEDVLELSESIEGELEELVIRQVIISSFAEQVKRLEVDFIEELSKQDDDDDDDAATDDRRCLSWNNNIDSGVELLGFSSELFIYIRDDLIDKMRPVDLCFFSLLGEVGTGTTIRAKKIFEDLRNRKNQQDCLFDCSAWVRVGAEYESKKAMIRILAQVDNLGAGEYEWLLWRDERVVCKQLNKALKNRRYMIVLDDVHDMQLIQCLRSSCPDQSNGSLILFTTSSEEISRLADKPISVKKSRRYSEESTWFLLRWFCFLDESVSAEIEEAGRQIVENCQGLIISVAKAILLLRKTNKSVEQWRKLAADKHNPIFKVEDELSEISEIKTRIQSDDQRDEDIVETFDKIFVRFYDSIESIKMDIHPERIFSKMQIVSLMGMAGIGKTTLARKVFKDMSIMGHFDCHVWLTLGPKYEIHEILIDILAHIHPSIDRRHIKGDAKLAMEQLSSKRCLIVLDDLWSKELLHYLKEKFPDIKGTTLVTTRLAEVANGGDYYYEMKLLDNEESWYLLRDKVFGEGLCSSEFEKVGWKIAEICDGLPLLIVTVAKELLKVEISLEYWNKVATGKEKSVFRNAHHEISKALLPSYEILPQYLKPCFLHIGVFRNMYEIPISKLTNLWIAEGLLESNSARILEAYVEECLSELVDKSLVMARRKLSDLRIKTCRHHSVFWHLSNSVAEKSKFFHAMNIYADCSIESIKSQRRLCIRNTVLLGIKDVYNAMEESTLKLRSLLCTGTPHQYQVQLYFSLRLLRELDAVALRFYEFPIEVVELTHLKYLGLTCNGKLPSSISQLWKLQYLIVRRYITTILPENSSLLPIEIWDMKELKHLQVMGGCLPNPKRGNGLRKLTTLLDVSAQSCTKKVLKRIPNLKRLGVRIELNPDGRGNPFRSLNRISRLGRLESLKCVVVNPHMRSEVVAPPAPVSMFPSSLKRLSLSGFGYPWEYMKCIGALKNLEVLKLKCYAFRGSKWEIDYSSGDQFNNIKFLLLEDTNLVYWDVKTAPFIGLRRLSLKHCYRLQELPICLDILEFEKCEIVDCSPATVSWVEQMREMMTACEVDISQSWIEE